MNLPASQQQPIVKMLMESKDQIAAALPKHMNADRITRIALTEFRKNPKLMQCNAASVMAGIFQSAQLGLEIGSGLNQAYLVPYKGQCQMIIGYQGQIDIAYRSGKVKDINLYKVKKDDKFEYYVNQDGPTLLFEPNRNSLEGELTPENCVCVLAQARLTTGGVVTLPVFLNDIEKARKAAQTQKVWNENWEAMAMKTAIRRLYKLLPKSAEMMKLDSIESSDGVIGVNQQFDALPEEVLDIFPVKNDDDLAYDEAMAKFMDVSSSAQQILGETKYAEIEPKLKDGTIKEINTSIEILNTMMVDHKKGK